KEFRRVAGASSVEKVFLKRSWEDGRSRVEDRRPAPAAIAQFCHPQSSILYRPSAVHSDGSPLAANNSFTSSASSSGTCRRTGRAGEKKPRVKAAVSLMTTG